MEIYSKTVSAINVLIRAEILSVKMMDERWLINGVSGISSFM
jgi:hypothetical protein